MAVPDDVKRLIEQFDKNADSYRSKNYNETRLRVEFLDPLFKALGWDVHNEKGYAEAYKDVIHEDAINIGGATKAPDYCFRIGSERKFFLEAKKPAVNIKEDVSPAYQLRRYAWSAKLPLSVLSDFEEFATYDCRVKPIEGDKSSIARIIYISYREYEDRWEEIYSIFSKQAVLEGSFDRYAETTKKKKGTAEVDDAFLTDIESWRDMLARNLALRNPSLSQRELNFSVQVTIDRIIFLRICEDRGIETYGQLLALTNGTGIYPRLLQVFQRADDRYNSGLFHFQNEKGRIETPDNLTPHLVIDDKILVSIIKSLYYPNSPYEFSVLPATILGHVYEQFLGKVIRLTAGHQAKVEDKPEVKKAGGVFYTPDYIVEYIVENTVGKLLEGKTPKQVTKLKILDPACGSGSFLIGAYQKLLDWHRDWYQENEPEKRKEVYQGRGGEWKLTVAERKRILLNNIYGVDIDPQAVEVTKLSLLLKVLEGESEQSLNNQLQLFQQRALPDLSDNIKCGNSLIGPDFYEDRQMGFDEDEHWRVNAFDWRREFSDIFSGDNPGFNAVIGNPPYIRIQRIDHKEADYYFEKYKTPMSKTDISQIFLEHSLSLSNSSGLIGLICTSQWLSTDYGRSMRKMLASGLIYEIVHFGSLPVFKKANTYPGIFIISPSPRKSVEVRKIKHKDQLTLSGIKNSELKIIDTMTLSDLPWNLGDLDVLTLLEEHKIPWEPLSHFAKAQYGIITGLDEVFVFNGKRAKELGFERELLFPYAYRGNEVNRYTECVPESVVIYPYSEGDSGSPKLITEQEMKSLYPNVYRHLREHKEELMKRKESRKLYAAGPDWYRHARPGSFSYIHPKKFIIKGIDNSVNVALLPKETAFSGANCPGIILNDLGGHSPEYLFAILNSKVSMYYLKSVCPPKLSDYSRFNTTNINTIPIRTINFNSKADKSQHDSIINRVHRMLDLNSQYALANTSHVRIMLQRQIDTTDHQIDQFVYELYELTPEEIKIVEEATNT